LVNVGLGTEKVLQIAIDIDKWSSNYYWLCFQWSCNRYVDKNEEPAKGCGVRWNIT